MVDTFPTRSEDLDNLYTTTWALRLPKVYDQVMQATPFYAAMTAQNRMKKEEGGRVIEQPVRYAIPLDANYPTVVNNSVTGIGRGGTITKRDDQFLTVATYDWKNVTGHIQNLFADRQKNRGRTAVLNRVKEQIDGVRDSYIQKLETDLFDDATFDNDSIIGLKALVAEDPTTGTVGGLNPAGSNQAYWRNQIKDMAGKIVSVNLVEEMKKLWNRCGITGEGSVRFPNFIISDQSVYEAYESENLEIGRIMIPKTGAPSGDLGFEALSFKGAPYTWSPFCTTNSLYMLNLNFLWWVVDPIAIMKMGNWIEFTLQPFDRIAHFMYTCALVMGDRAAQGVMFNVSE